MLTSPKMTLYRAKVTLNEFIYICVLFIPLPAFSVSPFVKGRCRDGTDPWEAVHLSISHSGVSEPFLASLKGLAMN